MKAILGEEPRKQHRDNQQAQKFNDPAEVRISVACYRILLKAYPARFRSFYSAEMRQVFRDHCLDVYRSAGSAGFPGLWLHTLFDWFKSALAEHLDRETWATRPKFIRITGWAMMLGAAILFMSSFLESDWIRLRLYRLLGAPTSREQYDAMRQLAYRLESFPIIVAFMLLFLGVVGLRFVFDGRLGTVGRHGLYLAFAGSLVSAAGAISMPFLDGSWGVLMLGISALFGGLAAFGPAAVREGHLPGWIGKPLLVGFAIPLFLAGGTMWGWVSGGAWPELPFDLGALLFSAAIGSLLLLGYGQQQDALFES